MCQKECLLTEIYSPSSNPERSSFPIQRDSFVDFSSTDSLLKIRILHFHPRLPRRNSDTKIGCAIKIEILPVIGAVNDQKFKRSLALQFRCLVYLKTVSPLSPAEVWSPAPPWRQSGCRGRSGWRSSTGSSAWSWWWRWRPGRGTGGSIRNGQRGARPAPLDTGDSIRLLGC